VPRFDVLANRQPRQRKPDEPLRVLIVTAKCPGFNPEQVARTTRSLVDLKRWFDGHPRLGTTRLEPVWRITQGLETTVGVRNQLDDTTGADLASVLKTVDVMITTPSTAMLEGMRQGVPVAILDYHNRPHYVPAAWRITAGDQLDEVLPELLNPSPARMLYQDSLLHDALECHSAATPRLVELIETMHGIAKDCIARGQPLEFPRRILHDQQDGHHVDDAYDHGRLYPSRLMFTGSGRKLLPLEAIALARREGFSVPVAVHADTPEAESLAAAEEFLASFQQCRREWRDVSDELSAQWQRAKQRATSRLRSELQQARRELALWQRRSIKARLKRLSYKIRRLLRLTPPPARQTDDRRRQAA